MLRAILATILSRAADAVDPCKVYRLRVRFNGPVFKPALQEYVAIQLRKNWNNHFVDVEVE